MPYTLPDILPHLAPQADPAAVFRSGSFRVTVLDSRLLRLEFDPTGKFEDRASQSIWRRRCPVPEGLEVEMPGAGLRLRTSALELEYRGGRPGPKTLSIHVAATGTTWHFGDPPASNLGGTLRTLDMVDGARPLPPGLLSRDGWAVLDDSGTPVLNPQTGWPAPRGAPKGALDLYFFGFGHDYPAALRAFSVLSGPAPLIPRWALGNWWSRYWEYSAGELLALMDDFRAHQVPLSVCIIDMDWHITRTGNRASGWTGYTWNRDLFPDPPAALRALHERGLKIALNLHPADGVWPHEEAYPAVARQMGLDPAQGKPVPFDITDPRFAAAYFECLHHPLEAEGVDFWWIDWQQGERTAIPGMDPLWMLNHLHYYDLARDGKRPLIFSRFAGPGNQRYPIGFSGDTVVSWESLAFQPPFTAAAANIHYGWWSHDIGGHMLGIEDGELFARWVQFGAFSPILRLHSTKNAFQDRRPWAFDGETYRVVRDAMRLRHRWIPYLYTLGYRYAQESLAPLTPMAYGWPEEEDAYHCPGQYRLGSDLIAAPVTAPHDADTGLARRVVWLPEGEWYRLQDGAHFPSGWHALHCRLDEIPLFARAGALVPLAAQPEHGVENAPEQMDLLAFPGADGSFTLYEDDGAAAPRAAFTPLASRWSETDWSLTLGPAQCDGSVLPGLRRWTLLLRGVAPAAEWTVSVDGTALPVDGEYDRETGTLKVALPALPPTARIEARLRAAGGIARREDARPRLLGNLLRAFRLPVDVKADLAAHLNDLLADPARLAFFRTRLHPAQVRALAEVLFEAGLHRETADGKPRLIAWNRARRPEIAWVFTGQRPGPWWQSGRGFVERGRLPAARFVVPDRELDPSGWEIRLLYGDTLEVADREGGLH